MRNAVDLTMVLVEVQGHEQRVIIAVVARPAPRRPEPERLVEGNGRRVVWAHLEVDISGLRLRGEGGPDQGPRVSATTVFRADGDGRNVQLA